MVMQVAFVVQVWIWLISGPYSLCIARNTLDSSYQKEPKQAMCNAWAHSLYFARNSKKKISDYSLPCAIECQLIISHFPHWIPLIISCQKRPETWANWEQNAAHSLLHFSCWKYLSHSLTILFPPKTIMPSSHVLYIKSWAHSFHTRSSFAKFWIWEISSSLKFLLHEACFSTISSPDFSSNSSSVKLKEHWSRVFLLFRGTELSLFLTHQRYFQNLILQNVACFLWI